MAETTRWHELKRLMRVIPMLVIGGFAVGIVSAIARVVASGDLDYGLWRTALAMTHGPINYTV